MKTLLSIVASIVLLLMVAETACAQTLFIDSFNTNPTLSSTQAPNTWYTDRFAPRAFESAVFDGGNRLKHSISTLDAALNRPGGQQGAFYNTQGRKYDLNNPVNTYITADLYIGADWQTSHRRADIWGTMSDGFTVSSYPIIGFANTTGSNPTWRVWDSTAWVNIPDPAGFTYGAWYTLKIELTAGAMKYYIDGALVYTDATNGSITFQNMIIQAYNFGDPTLPPEQYALESYDVYWDNIGAGSYIRNITQGIDFTTIQLAIDAANPGDVINVAGGTYEEQLEITKQITLDGLNSTTTIIKSPVTLTKSFTTSGVNKPVVYIHNATGVVVKRLTVDGAGRGNTNYRFDGIAFNNAGGTIDDCIVKDIRDTPFSGNQHGVGIYAYNDDAVSRTLNVWNSTVTGFQKNGMALSASATTPLVVDVHGNTVTGAGATTVTAQNGIQVSAELGTGSVANNIVSGIAYDNTSDLTKWVATSILNFDADININGNTVTDGHMGIYNINGAGQLNNNTMVIKKIGVSAWGILATDPPNAKPAPFDEPVRSATIPGKSNNVSATLAVEVKYNTVTFSGGDNTATYGIEADGGYSADNIALTAEHNLVTGFEVGITAYQCESGCAAGVFTAVALHYNSLAGNTMGLYTNVSSPLVDASANWWGSASPDWGTVLFGTADYTPWCALNGTAALPGFTPDMSSIWVDDNSPQSGASGRIQEGIDLVSGSTVNIRPGTYSEYVNINKKVSLMGAGSGSDPSSNTVITTGSPSGRVVLFTASGASAGDPVQVKNVRIVPLGINGLEVTNLASVSYLNLDNVFVVGPLPRTIENENGFKIATDGSLSHLVMTNCSFQYCDYGWYFAKHGDWGPGGSNVNDVVVTNTSFLYNDYKGIYVEKLSNATFTNVTISGNGSSSFWNDTWNGGADINLKGQELYQNLVFNNLTVTNNGLGFKEGAGIMIKARDDGATYGAHPASLANVTINGGTFTGNERGIRFGEPGKNNATPTNVIVRNATISGNNKTYAGTDGSEYGGLINHTQAVTNAVLNYWGTMHGPADAVGTIEVPAAPKPAVAQSLNAVPAGALGNAVSEMVDYYPWRGSAPPAGSGGGVWAGGYVNPVSNEIYAGFDPLALDGVDAFDFVAPPPPPSDYLYLYFRLAPGQPIENYSIDIKKDEGSLATTAKQWDLKAITDHINAVVTLVFPDAGLPPGFTPVLYDLTTGNYQDLRNNPFYIYTSPPTESVYPFSLLMGDSTDPSVAVNSPNGGEFLVAGTPTTITWTGSDASGILRYYLYYSLTGSAPYTLIDSVSGVTTSYAWTPLAATTTGAIKVIARDRVLNEKQDVSNATFTVLGSNSISLSALAGWNLVSVPMLQGDMSPAGVFGDDYGATPYYTFQFAPTSGYTIPTVLNMGQGYWLGSNSAQVVDAVGTPLTGATKALALGFNIIGNPFAVSIPVSGLMFTDGATTKTFAQAVGANWISNVMYGYNGTSYYVESSSLGVWKGYWIAPLISGISVVYTPPVVVPTPVIAPVPPEASASGWLVELGASMPTNVGVVEDHVAAFGVNERATKGFDAAYDAPRPPRSPAAQFIEVGFAAPKGTPSIIGGSFARVISAASDAAWEFDVQTSSTGSVTLTWDNTAIRELSPDIKVMLYDASTHNSVNMKVKNSYTFDQTGTSRHFSINQNEAVLPVSYNLQQNYPNPFNPSTVIAFALPYDAQVRIDVYDNLGRQMATVVDGQKEAGYHEARFDGSNLSSGLYFYRMTAVDLSGHRHTDMKKMMLVK